MSFWECVGKYLCECGCGRDGADLHLLAAVYLSRHVRVWLQMTLMCFVKLIWASCTWLEPPFSPHTCIHSHFHHFRGHLIDFYSLPQRLVTLYQMVATWFSWFFPQTVAHVRNYGWKQITKCTLSKPPTRSGVPLITVSCRGWQKNRKRERLSGTL